MKTIISLRRKCNLLARLCYASSSDRVIKLTVSMVIVACYLSRTHSVSSFGVQAFFQHKPFRTSSSILTRIDAGTFWTATNSGFVKDCAQNNLRYSTTTFALLRPTNSLVSSSHDSSKTRIMNQSRKAAGVLSSRQLRLSRSLDQTRLFEGAEDEDSSTEEEDIVAKTAPSLTKAKDEEKDTMTTTYEVDDDEDAEQHIADDIKQSERSTSLLMSPTEPVINGDNEPPVGLSPTKEEHKAMTTVHDAAAAVAAHLDVLKAVGLDGKLSETTMNIPQRVVSTSDVFCNREIKLEQIKAIGFDMDYTLAQYKQPEFDQLAFDGAKAKLVEAMGYPSEVLNFVYDHKQWVRGLIVDIQRGNFLKIDRHKYVRVAYHGFQPIASSVRKHLYSRTFNKIPSFSEKHFVNLDTLFQHVDAHLYAYLIDLKDNSSSEFLDGKTYQELYKDVRACVDLCHRDGVIKDVVAERPEDFIIWDPHLVPMLESYRSAGVKTFLLTNSYWEYTAVAMNYLFHGKNVMKDDPGLFRENKWLDLFDLAIVGSCKPAFLVDPYLNLFRVDPTDGSLRNTDGVYEIEALNPNGAEKFLDQGKVFQGGNWLHLQALMKTKAGEEILYVGDHLYSDVLRSKRTLGWRTALIVPEMINEMKVFHENRETYQRINDLRQLRDDISSYADTLRKQLEIAVTISDGEDQKQQLLKEINELKSDDIKIKDVLTKLTETYHKAFHPVWGQMFVAGYQDSRLAFYVENYACLYTARASNLGLKASPERSFRTKAEMLPHDKMLTRARAVVFED